MIPDVTWFAAFGGPPCQKHSRRNSDPITDITVFEAAAELMHTAMQTSPNMHVLWENVIPAGDLIEELIERWDTIMSLPAQAHQALQAGSSSSRPRYYWLNGVIASDLTSYYHSMPAFVCDQSWTPESTPIQCLMAMGDLTDKPPMLVQMFTGDRRTANADERDRMIGTKAGFTCAFVKVP